MIKVSRKIEYALLALAKLSGPENKAPLSARDISQECHLPYDTVAKILKDLGQHQWLSSVQGAKGGYVLDIDLNAVNYLDLAKILDEKIETLACQDNEREGHNGCDRQHSCQISSPLKTIDTFLHNFFKNLSIQSILDPATLLPNWQGQMPKFPSGNPLEGP